MPSGFDRHSRYPLTESNGNLETAQHSMPDWGKFLLVLHSVECLTQTFVNEKQVKTVADCEQQKRVLRRSKLLSAQGQLHWDASFWSFTMWSDSDSEPQPPAVHGWLILQQGRWPASSLNFRFLMSCTFTSLLTRIWQRVKWVMHFAAGPQRRLGISRWNRYY